MNTELATASVCYGLYDGETIIGFCAVIHQPHGRRANLKRISRIVILPEYQGIGLGYRFLGVVAKHYTNNGYRMTIVTSAKNFINKLASVKDWKCIRLSVNKCSSKKNAIDFKRASMRDNNKTASFVYIGNA